MTFSSTTSSNPYNRSTTTSKKTTKVQCVVLGAADAGKTSLLRRYFRGTFDLGRVATVGSDFYTKKIQLQQQTTSDDDATTSTTSSILLQMFDTPGEVPERRRKRPANEQDDLEQQRHMQALLNAFVGRMDGVMLVYDMTSTTSFVQLRQWHAQWRKYSSQNNDNNNNTVHHHQPFLVVGNKRDLILPTKINNHKQNTSSKSSTSNNNKNSTFNNLQPSAVPQRDVMGFQRTFTGNDFRYEYRVDHNTSAPPTPLHSNNSLTTSSTPHHHHHHKPPKSTSSKSSRPNHRHQISTFSSTTNAGVLWTQGQDGTYLDSLLTTEDNSNPDRDMVKLWCMRNGLQHVEVSCLQPNTDGHVDVAMETLVQLVLEARREEAEEERQQQQQQQDETKTDPEPPSDSHPTTANNNNGASSSLPAQPQVEDTKDYYYRPNEELDLLERYRPKDRKCCFCFPPLKKLTRTSSRFIAE
ncbi:member RAS oncogene family [Seminavis robusta]|uniref:Member RAS oncogene family n=1 Tax=Seminavis robusta TaxID=568900 RepID=A0A9N8DSD9_9STRA|nr:member RAS oncogene family [Seminavis robusta]|eukprot:Sro318_g115990.1 member RAS oncogene family (467) ;mRNA; r:47143-48543